jgi:hypothetical protein
MLMIVGLTVLQVVGMSTSGVASTSRQAAQASVVAPPTTAPGETGAGVVTRKLTREETVGLQGLDLVTYPWKTMLPGWRIQFLPARKGYLAMTHRVERRIDVYVRSDRTPAGVAHDIAHEIGHAIDVTYLTDENRADFLSIRRLKATTAWWACNSCTDLDTGAGDFAESFALIAAPPFRFYSRLAPSPKQAELERIKVTVLPAIA